MLGDFNLAPRLEDGWFGDQPSTFTKPSERRAFQELLRCGKLMDATCPPSDTEPQFTFERIQQNRPMRFRCDLALLSEAFGASATVTYDHSVRTGSNAFTDHSAIIVDWSSIEPQASVERTFSRATLAKQSARKNLKFQLAISALDSHKTAISRSRASQIARSLEEQNVLSGLGIHSILDFGCGYGSDVQFYRSKGYQADGFDIEPRFGWTQTEDRVYDLVTVVFVVNVLPSIEDRLESLRTAARLVRPGGYLLIAARSESAIASEAQKGNWARFNDGWISSPQKRTFQKGILTEEITGFLGALGFQIRECPLRLSSDVSWALGTRPAAGSHLYIWSHQMMPTSRDRRISEA